MSVDVLGQSWIFGLYSNSMNTYYLTVAISTEGILSPLPDKQTLSLTDQSWTPKCHSRRKTINILRLVHDTLPVNADLERGSDRRQTVNIYRRRGVDVRNLILAIPGVQADLRVVLEKAI